MENEVRKPHVLEWIASILTDKAMGMIEAIDSKIEYMEAKTLKHSKMDDALDSLATMLQDSSANLNDVNIKDFINKISSMTKVDEKALAEVLINTKYNNPNKVVNFPDTKAKLDEEE